MHLICNGKYPMISIPIKINILLHNGKLGKLHVTIPPHSPAKHIPNKNSAYRDTN